MSSKEHPYQSEFRVGNDFIGVEVTRLDGSRLRPDQFKVGEVYRLRDRSGAERTGRWTYYPEGDADDPRPVYKFELVTEPVKTYKAPPFIPPEAA